MALDARRVINGTWGQLWLDGQLLAEVTGLQAQDNITYTDVNACGSLRTGRKLTGISGTGTLTLYHVNSVISEAIRTALAEGRDPRFQIMSKLSDPDADGREYYVFIGVAFDTGVYANWLAYTLLSDSLNFTYERVVALDSFPGATA